VEDRDRAARQYTSDALEQSQIKISFRWDKKNDKKGETNLRDGSWGRGPWGTLWSRIESLLLLRALNLEPATLFKESEEWSDRKVVEECFCSRLRPGTSNNQNKAC
jgi:hypothetical protein